MRGCRGRHDSMCKEAEVGGRGAGVGWMYSRLVEVVVWIGGDINGVEQAIWIRERLFSVTTSVFRCKGARILNLGKQTNGK